MSYETLFVNISFHEEIVLQHQSIIVSAKKTPFNNSQGYVGKKLHGIVITSDQKVKVKKQKRLESDITF